MRTTASFLFIFLITCYVHSAAAQGNSLLWKISGNGLTTPSYLYGTMHTKDARVFRLSDSVLTAFESCEAFAMEVIIDDASKMNILKGLFMDTSYSLKSLLTPEQYDSADQYCRKNTGQSIRNYEKLKPVYTAAILSQFVYNPPDSTGDDQQYFLDEYFQHLATDQQKNVHGLETIAEQLHVFDVLSYPHQAELLMQTVRRSNSEAKSYDDMVRYYLDNDLVKMMSFENDYSLPDSLYDGLITVRNHRMADRMDTLIKKRSTFVAVGAGHLGETEGLVNLLRDKGYTVLPVIPTYTNYLSNGWYRKTSSRGHFKVDFPSVPAMSNEKIMETLFVHYSASVSTYATEKHSYDVYIGEGRQDSVLLHVLQHHYQMKVFFDKISPDASANNKFQLLLETTDGRNCTVQCFERNQQVYVLLYTYKRKVNKEFRNRFFSSFQLL